MGVLAYACIRSLLWEETIEPQSEFLEERGMGGWGPWAPGAGVLQWYGIRVVGRRESSAAL